MIEASAEHPDTPTIVRDGPRTGTPLLSVNDLHVEFAGRGRTVRAVRGLTYDIAPGETIGLVGESGSGKSVSALSLLGLLPKRVGKVTAGTAVFEGSDILHLPDEDLRKIRGAKIAMIFQDPLSSLNPVLTIGRQITEALETHHGHEPRSGAQARRRAARAGRHPGRGPARRRLSAPVQRRHAPARDDRDGPQLRAEPAHRRRADDRARRHDPGPDPRAAAAPADRARDGGPDHHPRPRRRGRVRRPAGGHVRRSTRRARSDRDDARRSRPPVHGRAAALPAPPRPAPPGGPDADRGIAAGPRSNLDGCPFAPRCAWRLEQCWTIDPRLELAGGERTADAAAVGHQVACHHQPTRSEAEAGVPLADDFRPAPPPTASTAPAASRKGKTA